MEGSLLRTAIILSTVLPLLVATCDGGDQPSNPCIDHCEIERSEVSACCESTGPGACCECQAESCASTWRTCEGDDLIRSRTCIDSEAECRGSLATIASLCMRCESACSDECAAGNCATCMAPCLDCVSSCIGGCGSECWNGCAFDWHCAVSCIYLGQAAACADECVSESCAVTGGTAR